MTHQVVIIGAGPAGLLLGRWLTLAGIQNTIIEKQSRDYVINRIRAGLLEDPTVHHLDAAGVGDRLRREGQFDDGFELRFKAERTWVPMAELTGGKRTVLYPQQEVVKDLLSARDESADDLLFEVSDVTISGTSGDRATVNFVDAQGKQRALECDFVGGCDGFHGVSRKALVDTSKQTYDREYPFGWLGILADVAPSTRELIYAHHPNGFAMHSRRSERVSRLYMQVPHDANAENYDDSQIWEELALRLGTNDDWTLDTGPILQKSVTAMRSFVTEPLQSGRLFLAGDAAHIVPPTAAKGLNLAVADVALLAEGMIRALNHQDEEGLKNYTRTALDRIWRAQEFSRSMTDLLHHVPGDRFGGRLQESRIEALLTSETAMAAHCEVYVGLPFRGHPEHYI